MRERGISSHLSAFLKELEGQRCFGDRWLSEAVLAVPRHLFIDQYYDPPGAERPVKVDRHSPTEAQLRVIYSDRGLMMRPPPNHSAASQPSLVLGMLDDLKVERGKKVLEIGTGSGWNAALLAFGTGENRLVYSIDIQPDLIEAGRAKLSEAGFPSVNLMAGDGGHGWPDRAPFDRIVVTVGSPDIPPAWREQLAEDGTLLVPLKTRGLGDPLLRLSKREGQLTGGFTRWSGFLTLQGAFWSGSEDQLQAAGHPALQELVSREAKKVAFPDRVDFDCAFFFHLKGRSIQGLLDCVDWNGRALALFDRDSAMVCVANPEEPVVEVYGNVEAAERLIRDQREWIGLGRPRITDYSVVLAEPGALTEAGEGWIDRRPHATLRFSLASGSSFRGM